MAKSKHGKDDEYLRGIIREQTKEIRSLQRRIKELNKHEHFHDTVAPLAKVKPEKLPTCPACSAGEMETVIVANRIFARCNNCGGRTAAKKLL